MVVDSQLLRRSYGNLPLSVETFLALRVGPQLNEKSTLTQDSCL